jgi:hypothetical protein
LAIWVGERSDQIRPGDVADEPDSQRDEERLIARQLELRPGRRHRVPEVGDVVERAEVPHSDDDQERGRECPHVDAIQPAEDGFSTSDVLTSVRHEKTLIGNTRTIIR